MFRLNILSTLRSVFAPLNHTHDDKVDKVSGKGLSTNDYTSDEKTKLAGIATGANKTTVDSALSSSSTNPVQNSVINTALGNKVDKVSGKGLSTNDYTSDEKTKLAGIDTGANKTVVDSSLSSSSTNPVQNKVVNTALSGKANSSHNQASSTITEASALSNLGTSANATQATVNGAINTKIGAINTSISELQSIKAIEVVSTKPTASASTMNKLYLVSENSKVNAYYTVQSGSSYSLKKMDDDILDELSISWSDVTGKPSSFTPSSHAHGNITNAGAIGSTANLPVITGTNGVLQASSFGTSANTFCQGNDSRLSNARTPTSHAHGNISNEGVISGATSKNVVTDANGKITTENKPTIPTGSSTATDIKMNGTQSAGSSSNFAKADHVHPTDTSRAASSHTHGNITNAGAIGSTANLPVITGTNGVLQASSFGTSANTFCQGNDSRLSNTRTPTDNTVSTAKIQDSAVTSAKIADKTIVNEDIADATIEQAKMKRYAAGGASGTTGYVKILQFTLNNNYIDRPITFDVSQRHLTATQHFSIKFQTGSFTNYDAPLESFTFTGANEWAPNKTGSAYLYKEDTATYSLIVQKSEAYDSVMVRNVVCDNAVTITSLDTLVTTVPSGAVQATYKGFSSAEKTKLAGIATGANAYSHPSYTARTGKPTANQTPSFGGTATVSQIKSDSTGHVTEANDFTIKIPNTVANGTTAGLSTNDYTTTEKNKLAAITESADAVSYNQTVASSTSGAYEVGKITINGTATTIYGKDTNTTYSAVVAGGASGLMTGSDKTKLDGIATGANKTVVDSSLSSSSTNPVQNKVVNTALNGKADSAHEHINWQTAVNWESGEQYIKCYYNEDLGIATLKVYLTNRSLTEGSTYYLKSNGTLDTVGGDFVIPDMINPLFSVPMSMHNFGTIVGLVDESHVQFRAKPSNSSATINAYAIWYYDNPFQ